MNATMLALHIADASSSFAYSSIALVLLYFLLKRSNLPFRAILIVIVAVTIVCGTTHVLSISAIPQPISWISGTTKTVTATASLVIVAILMQIIPRALALKSPTALDRMNRQLVQRAESDRAAAASLREKNRLMAMAEHIAHVGHWRLDLLSNEIYWSDEVYRTYGLAPSTRPTLDDAFRGYHPDDRAQVELLVARSIAQGTPFTHESRIVRPDGSIRYIISSGQAERTPDGTTVAVFGVFQDVTDAKDVQRQRERLIERVNVATQGAHVGIWEWDIIAGNTIWDPIMFSLYGFDDAQFTPSIERWAASIHPDDRERVQREIVNPMDGATELQTEFRIVWPTGSVHNIRSTASIIYNEEGVRERIIGTNWDVTEVRTLADQLREEKDAATFAATHDTLTGLLNRRGLEAWIKAQATLAGTLLYLDIDGFKAVNDRGGHDAGDETLRVVARIIGDAVREDDGVARIGGDEFIIILLNTGERKTTTSIMARIGSAVRSLQPLGMDNDTRIGISIGVGHLSDATAFNEALNEADADLYRRKKQARAGLGT